jgi:biopolymer transport protein ExbD
LALAGCQRITNDTAAPAPSASVAVKLVDLPKTVSADDFIQNVFAVDVNADGSFEANGKRVTEQELLTLARQEIGRAPDLRAIIRADKNVVYQRVIHVMDLLKQAGISRLAFAVTVSP